MPRRYIIEGRVQGVGFRWFAEQTATRLGVKGWVRNRADGCVELLVDGSPVALERLHEALAQGPRAATVTRCVFTESAEPLRCEGFEIHA